MLLIIFICCSIFVYLWFSSCMQEYQRDYYTDDIEEYKTNSIEQENSLNTLKHNRKTIRENDTDDFPEDFRDEEKKKRLIIGEAKTIRVSNLSQIFPNIIPLRDQIRFWPANVPLTPFRAPFLKLPVDKPLSNFLLYKPEFLSPVRNQGDCGACWAFALCDSITDRLCILTGSRFKSNLSVQQLLECFEPNGCEGGSPEESALWLAKQKFYLTLESEQPYRQSSGGVVSRACRTSDPKLIKVSVSKAYSIVEFIDEVGYDPKILETNISNMKYELQEGGPFYCAMAVYDDLFTHSGLQPYSRSLGANFIGGHAIEIIGYCEKGVDKRKGFEDGYWFCRNSWGQDWPLQTTMSGFFMVTMGKNMCGIESRCGFADPVLKPEQLEKLKRRRGMRDLSELRYTKIQNYY